MLYKGNTNLLLSKNILGILGTEKPDPSTLKLLRRVITARKPDVIATTIGKGVAIETIRTALSMQIPLILILHSGFNRIIPSSYRVLLPEILSTGLLISFIEPNGLSDEKLKETAIMEVSNICTSIVGMQFAYISNITNALFNALNLHKPVYVRNMDVTGNQYFLKNKLARKALSRN